MTLYTGKGDDGTTQLFTSKKSERLHKSDVVFDALGTVDELNTVIGWCRCACGVDWMVDETPLSSILLETQQALFTIQAEIAGADKVIPKSVIQIMEQHIQYVDTKLPAITTFLIPGGSELSARLDMARAISRRAERVVVNLNDTGIEISADTLMYVNRLSTLLYALVRLVNYYLQVDEQKPQYFEEMQ